MRMEKNKAAQEMVARRNELYGKEWLSKNGKRAIRLRWKKKKKK